eukprot:TRINITY_DN4530_c0_g1_i5.p1 TRINITY_DN4530_c0_g1~~TRINITY_DN4530_c0_g1_i5.p1  ORF type:complete len:148 (-),score=5.44 TRINITY_DN4530_c0_g1_i5:872-1315(-)
MHVRFVLKRCTVNGLVWEDRFVFACCYGNLKYSKNANHDPALGYPLGHGTSQMQPTHSSHPLWPSASAAVSAGHCPHPVWPSSDWDRPRAQGSHTTVRVRFEYRPALQLSHEDRPGVPLYRPGLQSRQLDNPLSGPILPGWHEWQCD